MSQPILSSRQYYDGLASVYDRELADRASFARTVDALVVGYARQRGARTIIDVGCGNGHRLKRLIEASGLEGVGIDESPAMVEETRRRGLDALAIDISSSPIDVTPLPHERFDLVVALWNVLGHVSGHDARRRALTNMRSLAAEGGAIILDVNNRYNAAQYGWWRVVRNVARDLLGDRKSGDFVVRRESPSGALATVVHVFARGEILALCREAGLRPAVVRYVDYDTGRERARQWSGQLYLLAEPVG